jgi:[acyl-carrier-protein] S-malonyltransferase
MGKLWVEAHPASAQTFAAADEAVPLDIGGESMRLSSLCFNGPSELLNRTDVSQPALYTCAVAAYQGLLEEHGSIDIAASAGLSLGEWTALHLAGAIGFTEGLRLVALRGRLMQSAAEQSDGSMVALIGADEAQAQAVCDDAAKGEVLVPANFNAPGQVVLSGASSACERAIEVAEAMGLRAKGLAVAGAFHSPLMEPAAEGLANALEEVEITSPAVPVWSNVTGRPHDENDVDSIKSRLVQQLTSPVRWSQCCESMVQTLGEDTETPFEWHELAPGSVLRGLFRRIDRAVKVHTHDKPEQQHAEAESTTPNAE